MKKKILIILMAISLTFSCTHRRTAADLIDLGKSTVQYNSVDEYLQDKNASISDSTWIKFMFLNNPYGLTSKNIVSIYVNYELVYRDGFKKLITLKGSPDVIFAKDNRMMIRMEILTDKKGGKIWLHNFQSKTVFSWNEDYMMIYCGFFPTNENVEQVYFIPQIEPMI